MRSPLDGIRILDLTIFQNGPWGTVMLSDMGAEVIKIEDPVNGDPGRNLAMLGMAVGRVNAYFETMNRNKKAITLNLKSQEGRDIFYTLAKGADVIVQNFRVGVAARLGIDYETVKKHNPGIIYASVSGFGPKGPDAADGVLDPLGQARGGLMLHSSPSDDDVSARIPGAPADQTGAIVLAHGVLLGIIARERFGIGQHIEVSQLGGQLILQALAINGYLLNGETARPRGRTQAGNPLLNTYRCGDGRWIALAGNQPDRFWPPACQALGITHLMQDARFCTREDRSRNRQELIAILDGVFATRPRDHWVKTMKAHGVFCAPVQSYAEVVHDPQVLANEYLAEIPHPTLGVLREVGVPVKLSETPGAARSRAPEFGEHTEEVLIGAGYTWEQIAAFRGKGVI